VRRLSFDVEGLHVEVGGGLKTELGDSAPPRPLTLTTAVHKI